MAAAPLRNAEIGAAVLAPSDDKGVSIRFFSRPIPHNAPVEDGEADHAVEVRNTRFERLKDEIEVPRAQVDLEGAGHSLHETRTDVATRGLIRDLADHPEVALTVLVAQLFKSVALSGQASSDEAAAAITATAYRRGETQPMPTLDGEVRSRLEARRTAYKASGLRPIGFVGSLKTSDKLGLLAELVAMTLNVREARTTQIRHAARAEAMEIAALCQCDIAAHWTPDEHYLGAHSKKQLLKLLKDMGVDYEPAADMKKDALVNYIARAAAERSWAPPTLSWRPCAEEGSDASEDSGDGEPGDISEDHDDDAVLDDDPDQLAA